ncbi:hypothetical protein TNCV_2516941 [Trichonephila clavipes]|nr:hypothetical protein TNCV_2516941 [Trichonephila clavipes]
MSKPNSLLNRQPDITGSSRDLGSFGIFKKSLEEFPPQDIVGPEFVHVLRLHAGMLQIIHQRLFWDELSLQNKTKTRFVLGSWQMMQARTWPCRAAYSNASGFSGSVTGITVVKMCSGGSHRFGPSCWTDVKRRDESSFILSNRMCVELSDHECLNQS